MGCNCKASGGTSSTDKAEEKSLLGIVLKYSAKIMGFLIGLLLTPLIMLGVIWFMFDTIVLNKEVDLTIILKKIVKINRAIMDDDEEEDDDDESYVYEDEDSDEDDYITENVEEIK